VQLAGRQTGSVGATGALQRVGGRIPVHDVVDNGNSEGELSFYRGAFRPSGRAIEAGDEPARDRIIRRYKDNRMLLVCARGPV